MNKLNSKKGILLMLCSSVCTCFGQLLWKFSAGGQLLYMFLGFGLYGLGALFMLTAYKHGKLSVLQPILSMSYVIAIILGVLFLDEVITINKGIGIITIIFGVLMIARGDK